MLIDDIECVDIDVSNICNLKCPLCASIIGIDRRGILNNKQFADFDVVINRLKSFRKLKTVQIAGAASEPMLHPQILHFIRSLMQLGIKINIFTNGSTINDELWKALACILDSNSQMIFTICGTTQKMHSRYRIGSSLLQILHNARIFKHAQSNAKTHMQYIRFQYNKTESDIDIQRIAEDFSSYGILNTDTIYERHCLDSFERNGGICSDISFAILYRMQQKKTLAKAHRKIICNSLVNKVVQMDPYGNIFPCLAYRLFSNDRFENGGVIDYSKIINDIYRFCYECDEDNLRFLSLHNRDPFYMCDSK